MEKKISFILPTYNTERQFVIQSIQSVLNQSYKNLELIIIDDGSSNEYSCFLEEYVKIDNRIRLVRNASNMGLVFSLNRGLSLATGVYCFRMDADDICKKNRAKVTVKFLEKHQDVDIVGSQFKYLQTKKKLRIQPSLPESNEEIHVRLLWGTPFAHPTICFRRNSIKKYEIKYDNNEKAEDYNLWVRCAIKGCRFANIHQRLLRYRIHDSQITHVLSDKLVESNSSIRNKLFLSLNVVLTTEEKKLFDSFANGCILCENEFESINLILRKMISEIPESYATRSSLRKVLSEKYYHECLRSTLYGRNVCKSYKESELSNYLKLKLFRIFVLKSLPLILKCTKQFFKSKM